MPPQSPASFADSVARAILAEGAVVERLRRDPAVPFDPEVLNAGLPFTEAGRAALGAVVGEYLDVALAHHLPLVLGTPTWRADAERTDRVLGRSCEEVNGEGVRFVAGLRSGRASVAEPVWIAGLLGPRGDAYDPGTALSSGAAATAHARQAGALAEAGADFLLAATIPALSEALGMARAMGRSGLPYVLSFVLRPSGALLDGTPLHQAVTAIDEAADPAPLEYWSNCTHPTVFAEAMEKECATSGVVRGRVGGLQANASPLPPEQLDGADELHADDPERLAGLLDDVHRRFGTRVLGGCCGTDARHIRRLAERLAHR